MAINWGALSPIQAPQAVGQAAPANPNAGLNGFAGGLMSGLQQGSAINANNQSVAASKQAMDQSAQMFPLQKQEAQQKIDSNNMALQGQKQAAMDAASIREATKKGDAAVYNAMYAANPVDAINFLKAKSDLAKGIADTADKVADTKAKNLNVQQQTSAAIANVFSSAYQAENTKPGSGQQVLDIQLSQLDPETQKMLISKGMNQYSNSNVAAAHSIGQNAIADIQAAKEAKNAPTIVKLQNARDSLQAKIDAGTATDADKQNLDEQNKQIQGLGRANVESPLDKINVSTAQDSMKQAHEQAQKNIPVISNLESFKQQMGGYNVGALAPTDIKVKQYMQGIGQALGLKINTNAGVAEELESVSNQLKLQFASDIKGARMNQKMFNALSQIPPSVENTPQGARLITDRLLYLKKSQNAFTDFQDQYIQKNGNVNGVEKAWSNFLASAPLIKADGSLNEKHLQDDSTPFMDPKFKGTVAPIKEEASASAKAPEGRIIVKDKNGNLGHIPENQLQDALKSGFTQVQ